MLLVTLFVESTSVRKLSSLLWLQTIVNLYQLQIYCTYTVCWPQGLKVKMQRLSTYCYFSLYGALAYCQVEIKSTKVCRPLRLRGAGAAAPFAWLIIQPPWRQTLLWCWQRGKKSRCSFSLARCCWVRLQDGPEWSTSEGRPDLPQGPPHWATTTRSSMASAGSEPPAPQAS